MHFNKLAVLASLAGALVLGIPAASAAPIYVLNGNKIASALNVDVGGTIYNVDFLDGACTAVFGNCDVGASFVFQTQAGALAASNALLDQVLVNGDPAFSNLQYDLFPELTNGCSGGVFLGNQCLIATPYRVDSNQNGGPLLFAAYAINGSPDLTSAGAFVDLAAIPDGGTSDSEVTWARWRLAQRGSVTVPEPGTPLLMTIGGLILWLARRRARRPARLIRSHFS